MDRAGEFLTSLPEAQNVIVETVILRLKQMEMELSSLLQMISLVDLVRYCVSVCNQIACHLHICVFKIKPCSPLSSASH